MNLNKQQLICINTLISKLNLQEQKPLIVSGFSCGRTESSKELYIEEATAMIGHLKRLGPDEQKAEKMRRKIISMAHEMFWHLPNTRKIDIKRLDGWCVRFGYKHKKLDNHTYAELPKLVTQFEGVYNSYLKSIS